MASPAAVGSVATDPVRALQHALYRAAKLDPERRFHALWDKVFRRDVLWRAWVSVFRNGGAPGVDKTTLADVQQYGVTRLLDEVATELKDGSYRPLPARRVLIPKSGDTAEVRPLSIPSVRDRIVQAAVKIVLEPVFEADMLPCSFGFRPKRGAHDALQVLIDESWREAVLLSGEPGSGKTHTAQQILSRRFPQTTPCIIECSSPEKVDGFLDGATRPGPVILAHVDHLAAPAGYRVREVILRRTAESGSFVATANLTEPRREQLGASPVLDAIDTRVDVPTLRARREDIEPLGKLFAAITCGGGRRLRNDAIHLLLRYPWPGNVRELKTVVTEAAHRARREIVPEDLPKDIRRLATRRPLGPLEQAEADAILQALHVCNNNKVQAAALLQISRSRLYRKMREYGLVGAVLP